MITGNMALGNIIGSTASLPILWYARGIDFRRFSYTKPSDFRRNFFGLHEAKKMYKLF